MTGIQLSINSFHAIRVVQADKSSRSRDQAAADLDRA